MVDWSRYLESICQKYAQWWQVYTITDVVGKQQAQSNPAPLLFDFGLMVQRVERDKPEADRGEQKIERLGVLEGLRKYAPEHVLLVGRPGSGKSTALVRLLLEEAEQGKLSKIPVLVELRYYQTSVLDLIRDFCQRHRLWLESAAIEQLLFQGQLLLLVDGINELPSDQARRDLQGFRNKYQDTPMIFTTRDLGVGGDLDIAKKLEMQPLTEVQTQQFIRKYLPEQGEQLLKQLGPRLRELGQTPLLLMMLCSVFAENHNQVPANLGSVFRKFTQIYDNKLKQDIPASGESRRWWHRLLQHLAWVMSRGESLKEIQVAIPKRQTEDLLTEFLQGKVAHPEDCALCWLEDLLKYHLIQLGAGDKIEFRHQLIQEYYTAESLLKLLSSLSDEELKREYINYLKWTEPLVLMLELVDSQAQAVRVVKLALEVDLLLGARLAGAVKPKWQEQTVSLVAGLEVSQLFKVELLGLTKSERAVYFLNQALEDEDCSVRRRAAYALGNIGTEAAITALIKTLEDQDCSVRRRAADALGNIGSEAAIIALISALEDEDSSVRGRAAEALGKIGSEAAIDALIRTLEDEDSDVGRSAAEALGKIGSEAAIDALIRTLEDEDSDVGRSAASVLGKIGSEAAITALIRTLKAQNSDVCWRVASVLGKIGSEAAITALIRTLEDQDSSMRGRAALVLGKIGSKPAITALIRTLEDQDPSICWRAAETLGRIGSQAAITALIRTLKDKHYYVRQSAAEALGKIGSQAAIPALIRTLEYQDSSMRERAAEALGNIGSEAAITALIRTLEYQGPFMRGKAAQVLGKIGSQAAIPALIRTLEDKYCAAEFLEYQDSSMCESMAEFLEYQNSSMRERAAEALGNIGSQAAVPALIKTLEDQDCSVRGRAAEALGNIGSQAAVPALIKTLEDQDCSVCGRAAESLGNIGSQAAVPALIRALEDQDSSVRERVAEALGKIGSEAAIDALIKALEDKYSSVRRRAAEALGNIGSQEAIDALIKALEDKYSSVRRRAAEAQDSHVRGSAAEALGKIGTEASIPALISTLEDQDSSVRWRAAYALGEIGTEAAITALISALKDQKFVTANNGITFDFAIKALKTIQERFKFYNYTLTQPHLPPAKPNPICPMNQKQHSPSTTVERNQVFISYSHQDKIWLERLQTMLKPLMRNQTISVWDDTRIRAGAKWREEITKALAVAKVAVLMVSSNFLASDFIAEQELPPLLKAAEQQGLTIIWVYLSACMYKESEIGDYQAAHNLSKPLNTLDDGERDLVLLYICQEIKAAAT
ncbi:MAG: TIR domain-containing protein [Symploca sp. SIO3C6]|nr:TIR domain-containing protein [Symploca sp. SIO3C6]